MTTIACAGFVDNGKNAGEHTPLGFTVDQAVPGTLKITFNKPLATTPVVLITPAVGVGAAAPFIQDVSAAHVIVGSAPKAFHFACIHR